MELKAITNTFGLALALLTAQTVCATTGYWTGAVDGDWSKSANWQGGTIPGVLTTGGSTGDTAVFSGANLTGEQVTTIDLANLASICYIKVDGGATTPVFTFGLDSTQIIPLEVLGELHVGNASDRNTTIPVLRGNLALSIGATTTDWSGTKSFVRLYNYNRTDVLHLNDFGASSTDGTLAAINSLGLYLQSGAFAIDGSYTSTSQLNLFDNATRITFTNGRLFDANGLLRDIYLSSTTAAREIVVPEGQVLDLPGASYAASGYFSIHACAPLTISGAGDILFRSGYYNNTITVAGVSRNANMWPGPMIRAAKSGDVTITTRIFSEHGKKAKAPAGEASGLWIGSYSYTPGDSSSVQESNTVTLAGVNCVSGTISCCSYGGAVRVDSIGLIGEQSRLGFGSAVRLANDCRLEYTGAGETANRTILITNFYVSAMGVLKHLGSGLLTYAGIVSQEVASATFALDGLAGTEGRLTAPLAANFAGAEAATLALEKRGAGTWTLAAVNAYNGETTISGGVLKLAAGATLGQSPRVTLAGGALALDSAATATAVTLPPLVVGAAGSALVIGANRAVTLAALPTQADAGTLDIQIADFSGSLTVTGVAAGAAPAWITVNGAPAKFDATGRIHGRETIWTAAADGNWATDASWSMGAPNPQRDAVLITPQTVSVTTGDATMRMLAVKGDGAKVAIGAGAVLFANGTNTVEETVDDAVARETETIRIEEGATVEVNGGLFSLTNHAGKVSVVSDDAAKPSRLRVTNGGTFRYGGTGSRGQVTIGAGGRLEVVDATVEVVDGSFGAEGAILTDGGAIDVSGASVFRMTREAEVHGFGSGTTTFGGTTRFIPGVANQKACVWIRPQRAGETATVTFNDKSKIDAYIAWYALGGVKGGRSVLNLNSDVYHNYPGTYASGKLGYWMGVGQNYGQGELTVTAGTNTIGAFGMCVGGLRGSDYAARTDCAATGIVTVAGGYLMVDGYAANSHGWDEGFPIGLTVGMGTYTENRSGRPFVGTINVTGGQLETSSGHLLLGTGFGQGTYRQTGGRARILCNPNYEIKQPVEIGGAAVVVRRGVENATVVGLAGGLGRIEIEDGEFYTWTDMYVGGASTNVFNMSRYYGGKNGTSVYDGSRILQKYPFDRHDADGKVTVSGGRFDLRNDRMLTLGADGRGEFAVLGSLGRIYCANMTLSNQTESVVSFTADANGVSPIQISGKLTIAAGAKLAIDLSKTTKTNIPLFSCGSVEGGFAAANVSVTGADGATCTVVAEDGEISLCVRKGLILLVK